MEFALALHAAGPFVETSAPMVRACLSAGAHYVDITGEIPVFEEIFTRDTAVKRKGITLLPGAGFDVVPGDCLAKYVADQVPGATRLDLAVAGMDRVSPRTVRTMLRQIPRGMSVRCTERVLKEPPTGACTPAGAFGADFVLEIFPEQSNSIGCSHLLPPDHSFCGVALASRYDAEWHCVQPAGIPRAK
ncbi:MAG: hypothetical protein WAO55_01040 [Candidatus Manganitrophaceae bacterium]